MRCVAALAVSESQLSAPIRSSAKSLQAGTFEVALYLFSSLAAFCKNFAGIGWRNFQIIFIGRLPWRLT
jgi:hypothetical protein